MKNEVFYFRYKSGLNQLELSKMCGTSRTTLSSIERGKSIPSVKLALKIARALNTDINNLFKLEL